MQGHSYEIYGDPAYPLRPLLAKPYTGAMLSLDQQAFKKCMNSVRQAVEWGFGKIATEFAFADLKTQKILLQSVPRMYRVAIILANCHKCFYRSRVAQYFGMDPQVCDHLLRSDLPRQLFMFTTVFSTCWHEKERR